MWRAAEFVPWVGPNLTAVRQLASAVHFVTDKAIEPLTHLAGSINLAGFRPVDGAIDLAPIAAAQPQLKAADAALKQSLTRLHAIDTSGTVSQVTDATSRLLKVLPARVKARMRPAERPR